MLLLHALKRNEYKDFIISQLLEKQTALLTKKAVKIANAIIHCNHELVT